ncbi:T9SS type B sorting domain-containing protein, partial [uncultured Flavobacterium sp.]|uniref:T9SS type B sorting domain-containing protein n=1 Tax=uncultured Flavobacterium sp. TaxID=165435 RepID=UPI0030EC0459
YENITLPGKKITTFDGYAVVASNSSDLDIPVSGFSTLPAPFPVRAKLGISTLEGDNRVTGDQLLIKANSTTGPPTILTNTPPPAAPVTTNYFNSSITLNSAFFNARNPNSRNTLGWDAHLNLINNPSNTVIPNNETGVILTAKSSGDKYDVFFTSFDVEIIEPQIPLLKQVEDIAGNNVNGQTLSLGQEIFYTLTFQNTGNDNALNFTLTDILPTNAIFPANGTIQPGDLILPPGVTYVFNPTTNQFTFSIPDNLVEIGDPAYTIKIKVKLPLNCEDFRDACTNQIINQAYVSYNGELNTQVITDNPSFNGYDNCNYPTPGTTNFIANIDDCIFTRTEILCGNTLDLTGADGYDTYLWQDSSGNTIGNTQTITVNATGTYTVFLSIPPPCVSIYETVNVVDFNNAISSNPATPYANVVETCPNDGSQLPKIFLCGLNDSVLIQSGVNNAISIQWQQLVPGSCPPIGISNCANTNSSCTWNTVGTGPNFNVTTGGEYQVTFNYQNGCFRNFYFNVFQNTLNPDIVTSNIICTTQGSITINNIPSTYEFSLSPTGPFSSNNVIPIATAGNYTVYIQQTGVAGGCLFEFPNINILSQILDVDVIVTDKLCNDGFGSIRVQTNGVEPQYYFQISQGATTIVTFGPSTDNDHLFSNLNPGTYTVTATTDNGCSYTEQVTIQDLSDLAVSAAVTQNISCVNGQVTLTPSGGLAPYNYAVFSYNGVPVTPGSYAYQAYEIFEYDITQIGTYQYIIVDSNNCISLSNIVTVSAEPTVTITETHTNVTCSGLSDGIATISALPTNGYVITYSIDGGITYQNSNVFNGLAPGTYTIDIKYTKPTHECDYTINVTITEPTPLTGQSQVTQQLTCITTGTIQAFNVTGGTAPYQYSINGVTFQNSSSFPNLTAGTYVITIRDFNNCTTTTTPITFVQPLAATDLTFTASSVTCPTLTSNVTATIVGGTAPFVVQITAPSTIAATSTSGNIATFNNLAVGSYTFNVTDANGCTYQENFTINPITFINVTGSLVSNVICFGASNGAVSYNVTGFNTTYSYTVNGGTVVTNQTGNTINLNSLAAGNYAITVTDNSTNCQSTVSVTVAQPSSALTLNVTTNPITCIANGTINAAASGGWGSYAYTLTQPNAATVGPQSSGVFANQTQTGTYTISVTDGNGCVVTNTATLSPTVNPTLTISPTSTLCYNATTGSTVILTAASGIAPYQYSSGGAFQASNTFSGLTPGNYTFTVRDSYGCTATVTQTITPALLAQAIITKSLDCSASPNAIITVNVNGGTTPYQYQVNFNGGAFGALNPIVGSSFTYSTAIAGTYQFLITDATGCTYSTSIITINPITTPDITSITQTQQNLCNGDTNGAIQVNINNTLGTSPFQYSIDGGITYQSSNIFNGLAAGTYTVIVRDSKLCTDTESITLVQPDAITFDISITEITCNNPGGTSYGEVIFENILGGTQPYTYYLSSNFGYTDSYATTTNEDHTFIVLNFGIYTAEVIDSNGCSVVKSNIIIASPPDDLDIDISTATADCTSGGTAIITVSSLVSSGSYEFGILETNTLPYTMSYQLADVGTPETSTFIGLVPGVTYTFVVHDLITDCYYFETANGPIPSPSNLTTAINVVQNVTCTGSGNGTISFTFNNYDATTTSVDYEIFYAQSNVSTGLTGNSLTPGGPIFVQNFGILVPGTYYILLTENGTGTANGCTSATPNFTITQSTNQLIGSATLIKNDNCNPFAGIVTATGQFGTAPYQYQILLSTDPAPTVATFAGTVSNTFNVESGSYIVYVKDANNCIVATNIVVVGLDPSPEITLSLMDPCANEGSFTINGVRTVDGIAPYTITVDGNTPYTENATNFSIANLLSGSHTVIITDANGCTYAQTILIDQIINGNAMVTIQPSCADNDGEIQATATNGSTNYSFELQTTAGVNVAGPNTTGLFTGLGFGNYNVIISDATLGCDITIPLSLEQPAPVSFTTSHENVSCNGATDGSISITLDATNIDTPYTYSLFDGTTTITQNSPNFTGLAAGNYTITVTSSKNCTDSQIINVTQPNPLALSLIGGNFACNSNNTVNVVTVTANVALGTGTAPYLYSIDGTNYQTANTFDIIDNGTIQNITITVQDFNGCTINDTVLINPLPTITNVAVTQNTALTCANDEEVLITVTSGSGNYTYQLLPNGAIVGPTSSNTATFSLSAAGTYTFEVIDTVTGCSTITAPYTINPLPVLTVVADNANAVNCYGEANGSFDITVSGYVGNYNYNIYDDTNAIIASGSNNTTTNPLTLTGLGAGNFYVQIIATDPPFCETISNVINIYSPPNPLTLVVQQTSDVTCNVPGLGTITAQANGGNGTFEYQLVNTTTSTTVQTFGTNSIFTDLDAGTYEVTVRDINLCEISQIIILNAPTPIDATYVVTNTNLLCYNNTNASVTITATGGQGSYQFTLTDENGVIYGPQIENIFENLGAGTYTITVNDGWNCDFSALPFTITEKTEIEAILSVQSTLTCDNNAQIIINASGGTPPYMYSTNGTIFNSTNIFSVGPGTYQYYVTDANNCTSIITNSVTIAPIDPLTVTINASNTTIQCNGDVNASITVNATGGLGNYNYTLLNSTTMAIITGPQTSNIFSPLGAGSYIVNVNSVDCDQPSNTVIITQPLNPLNITNYTVTPATCNGTANGSITFNPTGGTPPYQYAITNHLDQFFNTNTFIGLGVGTYTVVIQDTNGCFETINVQMTEPAPLVASSVNTFEVCEGSNNGTATLTITGGTPPYYTSLDDDTSTSFVQGQLIFNNLDSTVEHTIYVHDANDCQTNIYIPAGNPVTLTPTITPTYACTSATALQNNTVTVNVEASNVGQVQYSLDNQTSYQSNNVYTNLTNGTHTIYVQHTNGCVKTVTVDITNWIPVTETHSQVNVLCNSDTTGSITANGVGGNGTYQYAISPTFTFGIVNIFNSLAAGTYTIKIRDGRGCETEFTTIITQPTALNAIVSDFGQDVCQGDNSGYVQVTASGGVGPYMASFNNTTNYVAVNASNIVDYFNLAGGATYTIYIKDANGCVTSVQQTLDPAVDLDPKAVVIYDCLNNQSTNTVTITVDAIYQNNVVYSIDGISFQLSNTFTNLSAGNYTAYVEHSNGCFNSNETFTIDQIDAVALIVTETGLNEITAVASGGIPPYTYVFNGTNTGSTNVFIFNQTGNQYVSAYDANGCEANFVIQTTFYPIEIPNFFTPDGNGFNDFWSPKNVDNYTNIESLIFDRYGREIIRLKLGESWNGTYDSIDLPSGDYWYLVNVNDGTGRTFTGNFTLYR